jgi:hypothetical protein
MKKSFVILFFQKNTGCRRREKTARLFGHPDFFPKKSKSTGVFKLSGSLALAIRQELLFNDSSQASWRASDRAFHALSDASART